MTHSGLTSEQIQDLYHHLFDLKNKIEQALNLSAESSKPVSLEESIGRISRMDALLVQRIAKTSHENLSLQLKQVNASIEDYQNGQYGLCRMCQNPIGYPRLSAKPESPFCFNCQKNIEAKSKP